LRVVTRAVLSRRGLLAASASAFAARADELHGGTLRIFVRSDPPAVVSAGNASGPSKVVSGKIIEGLLTYDFSLNPRPHLATSWRISPDKREFTFVLREGVAWHDGTPFTAADVAYSIRLAAEIHPTGRVKFRNLTEIRTPDRHTVTVVFSQPNPAMLTALSGVETAVLPSHLYEGKDYFSNPVNLAPTGTGPFRFSEWKRGDFIRLTRNTAYWDQPRPYLDEIVFRIVPDPAATAAAFEAGEADLGYNNPIPLTDLERFRLLPHIGIEAHGYEAAGDWTTLVFNLDNPYLKHLPVRQAIAHAVDKQVVLELGWSGYGTIVDTPIGPSLERYRARDVRRYEPDLRKSEDLLDGAGFPRGPGGVRFNLTIDPLPSSESFRKVASYLRQALGKIGITVTIRGQDFATWVKRVYADRDFDLAYAWLITGTDPSGIQSYYDSSAFKRGVPFSNAAHYDNPTLDALLRAAAVEIDESRRIGQYIRVQRILADDLPGLDLVAQRVFTVYNTRLHDHTVDSDGIQSTLARAYLQT
jgi:peptide/nickel transport system substrate-binding protein